jgi:ferric-dicitrate binding protein FerR (iron transport regulator)
MFELLKNTSFLKWIGRGQPADDEQWNNWEAKDPGNSELARDAADIFRGIPFRKQQLEESQSEAGWDKIEARIKAEKRPLISSRRQIMRVAAAVFFLAIAMLAINWYVERPQWIIVSTAFGETKTILLPDNSEVILGANAELTYDKKMANRAKREVMLTGEAFFKVQRSDNGAPFSVQLSDVFIEVLGTSFNVNAYTTKAVISLVEGRLRLCKKQKNKENTIISSTLLEPMQTAWFDDEQQVFVLTAGETDYWTSWIDKEWSFGTSTTLATVLGKIETTYGLKAVVRDPSILDKKLAGKVSIESPEILFESLAVLLDLKITQKGQQLIIE